MLKTEFVKCAGKRIQLETIILFEVKQTHKDASVYISYVNVNFETFYTYV